MSDKCPDPGFHQSYAICPKCGYTKNLFDIFNVEEKNYLRYSDRYLIFGNYFIDKDRSVKRGIEWFILEEKDGLALIISRNIIDVKPYILKENLIEKKIKDGLFKHHYECFNNSEGVPDGIHAWNYEYSFIRHWLNNDFYNMAFNDEEKKIIKTTIIDNTETNSNKTEDKVFILLESEKDKYERFFANNKEPEFFGEVNSPQRTGYADRYGSCIGNDDIYPNLYMRRTKAYANGRNITVGASNVSYGVRPVMWIKL